MLAIHQDGDRAIHDVGKSEPAGLAGDADQHYGLELCRRGYAVLCPDRGGFEARRRPPDELPPAFRAYRFFTQDGTELTERLYAGAVANRELFAGRMPWQSSLFELHRAIDCLTALPEVDAGRLGVIGHSAGGQLAALLMYTDPRVRAGCSSCGTWLFRWLWGEGGTLRPINGFAGPVVPGMGRWGDVDDVLAGIAPRAFLELQGDAIEPHRLQEIAAKARARYAALGVPERFGYVAYAGEHAFPEPVRERAYAWLDRWLGDECPPSDDVP